MHYGSTESSSQQAGDLSEVFPKSEGEKQQRGVNLTALLTVLALTATSMVGLRLFNSETIPDARIKETMQMATIFKLDQCQDLLGDHKVDKSHCCSDPQYPVLGGVDVVSLFFQNPGSLPQLGKDEFHATLPTSTGEYTFLFASAENRDVFEAAPWKYAPAYGGFDSCGISLEERSQSADNRAELGPPVDLSKWAVVEDRLFFFGGQNPRQHFLDEVAAVAQGDANWQLYFEGGLQDGIFNTNCFRRQSFYDLVLGKESLFTCKDNHAPGGAGAGGAPRRRLYDDSVEDRAAEEEAPAEGYVPHIGSGTRASGAASAAQGAAAQGAAEAGPGGRQGMAGQEPGVPGARQGAGAAGGGAAGGPGQGQGQGQGQPGARQATGGAPGESEGTRQGSASGGGVCGC